jgi:hypothetical protein
MPAATSLTFADGHTLPAQIAFGRTLEFLAKHAG